MARATGRDPIVAVAGCVAQQEGEALLARSPASSTSSSAPSASRCCRCWWRADAARRARFPAIDVTTPYDEPSFPLGITRRADPVKAYVTIIEGCNDFCAFCVVPYTRGHERMRAKAEILPEVAEAAASGRQEVQLLGQIVNHYQAPDDRACDFPALLEAVNEVPGVERIRFASPHPRHTIGPADRGGARPAEGVQAPPPAGAVGLDAGAAADAPRDTREQISGHGRGRSARLSRTSSYRPI